MSQFHRWSSSAAEQEFGVCSFASLISSHYNHSHKMAHRIIIRPVAFTLPSRHASTCISRSFSTVIDAPVHSSVTRSPPTSPTSVFQDAIQAVSPRTNWTREEISEVYNTPLIELTYASVCHISPGTDVSLKADALSGYCSSSLPQSWGNPNVHLNEHQDWRV